MRTCTSCHGDRFIEVHCDRDWRDCEDGPGYHLHLERCYVCGGTGTLPDEPVAGW